MIVNQTMKSMDSDPSMTSEENIELKNQLLAAQLVTMINVSTPEILLPDIPLNKRNAKELALAAIAHMELEKSGFTNVIDPLTGAIVEMGSLEYFTLRNNVIDQLEKKPEINALIDNLKRHLYK